MRDRPQGGSGSLPLRPPLPVLLPCGRGAFVDVTLLRLGPSAAVRRLLALSAGEEEEEVPLPAEVPLLGGLLPPEEVLPLREVSPGEEEDGEAAPGGGGCPLVLLLPAAG
jgi:hypothetical protein